MTTFNEAEDARMEAELLRLYPELTMFVTSMKGTTMANTKTVTPPAPVPAATVTRRAKADPADPNVINLKAAKTKWRDSYKQAASATGYDSTSIIYGQTDLQVIEAAIAEITHVVGAEVALAALQQLRIRKVTKQIAGEAYRS